MKKNKFILLLLLTGSFFVPVAHCANEVIESGARQTLSAISGQKKEKQESKKKRVLFSIIQKLGKAGEDCAMFFGICFLLAANKIDMMLKGENPFKYGFNFSPGVWP